MSLYDHVRVIAPGVPLRRRDALVAAARSRNVETSVDSELETLRSTLETLPEAVPSCVEARRRVAETASQLETKRERVATLRGRLQEVDDDELKTEYRTAIGSLSEAETEHAAATEALCVARNRARTARDARERRLRLEDRLGNLKRRARRERLEAIEPKVDAAISEVPETEFEAFEEADSVSAALAIARVGRVERPIVLAYGGFSDRGAAERWLGSPVYRISHRPVR